MHHASFFTVSSPPTPNPLPALLLFLSHTNTRSLSVLPSISPSSLTPCLSFFVVPQENNSLLKKVHTNYLMSCTSFSTLSLPISLKTKEPIANFKKFYASYFIFYSLLFHSLPSSLSFSFTPFLTPYLQFLYTITRKEPIKKVPSNASCLPPPLSPFLSLSLIHSLSLSSFSPSLTPCLYSTTRKEPSYCQKGTFKQVLHSLLSSLSL